MPIKYGSFIITYKPIEQSLFNKVFEWFSEEPSRTDLLYKQHNNISDAIVYFDKEHTSYELSKINKSKPEIENEPKTKYIKKDNPIYNNKVLASSITLQNIGCQKILFYVINKIRELDKMKQIFSLNQNYNASQEYSLYNCVYTCAEEKPIFAINHITGSARYLFAYDDNILDVDLVLDILQSIIL